MGGNFKYRALRVQIGNFNWVSEGVTFKSKVQNVIYNASNNEHVRTKTLTKNIIVRLDAAPFRKCIAKHYFGSYKDTNLNFNSETNDDLKKANKDHKSTKFLMKKVDNKIDPKIQKQIVKGHLIASISSRPG
jgi:small subunit ribosomal protein S8e